jgi:Na+:H+ antiporter
MSGALSADIYMAVIIMVAATTVLSPIWLKKSYRKQIISEEKAA